MSDQILETIKKRISEGKEISEAELSYVKQLRIEEIKSKLQAGKDITDDELNLVREYTKTESDSKFPLDEAPGEKQIVEQIQNDPALRAQIGFLSEKYRPDVLNKFLEKKFPNIKTEIVVDPTKQQLYFRVGESRPYPLNPPGIEPGDIAQTAGTIAEPALGIGASIAGGPMAGIGALAGSQVAKEYLESQVAPPEKQQTLPQRAQDIGANIGTDVVGGLALGGLAKTAGGAVGAIGEWLQRWGLDINKIRQQAAKYLEEGATRKLEKEVTGAKPAEFGQELLNNITQGFQKIEGQAKKFYSMGDEAVKKDFLNNPKTMDISGLLQNLKEEIAFTNPQAASQIDKAIRFAGQANQIVKQQIPKGLQGKVSSGVEQYMGAPQRIFESVSPKFDPTKATAFDIQKMIESLSDSVGDFTGAAGGKQLIQARQTLKGLREQITEGTPAAQLYSRGDKLWQAKEDFLPPGLQKKVFGTTDEFGRTVKSVSPKSFFENLINPKSGTFTPEEADALARASGLSTSKALQYKGTKAAIAHIASKNLEPGGSRLSSIPEEFGSIAEKAYTGPGSEAIKKSANKQELAGIKGIEKVVSPGNEYIGPTYRATNLLKGLTSGTGGEISEVANPERLKSLFGEQFTQGLAPIEDLAKYQTIEAGRFIKPGGEGVQDVARQALPLAGRLTGAGPIASLGQFLLEKGGSAISGLDELARRGNVNLPSMARSAGGSAYDLLQSILNSPKEEDIKRLRGGVTYNETR